MSGEQAEAGPVDAVAPSTETAVQATAAPTDDAAAPGTDANTNNVAAAEPAAEATIEAAAPTPTAAPALAPAEASVSSAVSFTPPNASMTALEARMQSALAALMKVLNSDDDGDSSTAATAAPSLRSLQKMCMRIPQLSSEMTRPQRYRLYTLLLLDGDDETARSRLPESWSAYAEKALETHVAVAEQAAALFPRPLQVTVDELAGLFYHLGAETAFFFNPEMIDVILCITYVVAGKEDADKAVLLRALYRLLCVLQKDFLVSTASRLYEPATTALLRLMLQFYDPVLATRMDQQQVEVGSFVLQWSRRLLVLHGDYETALKVLDWVFILGDPVMIPFVALAYLVTHRQHLLSLQTKQQLMDWLTGMKFVLPESKSEAVDPELADGRATALVPVWSGKSLLQNADLLYRVTPLSTQRMLDFCLYPDVGTLNKTPEELQQYYANTPCLPLERSDLAAAFPKRTSSNNNDGTGNAGNTTTEANAADAAAEAQLPSREYIIVDCRSKASYDYVRLATAILVGDVLSYQHSELDEAMSRLESCRGRPLALFGTGRPIVEEVNLLKVLALFMINKKGFPFVCIVPGGFKTTIPLLRNGAIEAVLSPAAAAALNAAAAKSAGTDWAQQASDTAHNISAKLNEISGLLSHVETAEVRQKAEEIGAKAKESVAAAGTWGWGMMQRLREGLSETREHASSAFSSVATKLSAVQARSTAASASASSSVADVAAAGSSASGANAGDAAAAAAAAPAAPSSIRAHAAAQPASSQQPQKQIFSLGEDGEEEDLDLITSIPTRPMRGTVVEVPQPTEQAVTPTAAPAVAATLERRPSASAESPADNSPPVVDKTTATAPAASRAARGASASQIAANIDAEFDELFGDLSTSPMPATRASASPVKPSAAVDPDDLFGA
ncbi:Rab-GTPase-TBC domain containing protein [Lotmaria passim]